MWQENRKLWLVLPSTSHQEVPGGFVPSLVLESLSQSMFSILLPLKGTTLFSFTVNDYFMGEILWAHMIIQLIKLYLTSFSNHPQQEDPHLNQLLIRQLTSSEVFHSTIIPSGFISQHSLRSYFLDTAMFQLLLSLQWWYIWIKATQEGRVYLRPWLVGTVHPQS